MTSTTRDRALRVAAAVVVAASVVTVGRALTVTPARGEPPASAPSAVVDAIAPVQRVKGPAGRIVAPGVLEPRTRETRLAATVEGRVARVLVEEGARIDAGDVVAELDASAQAAALAVAERQVGVARAELARASAGLRAPDLEALAADEAAQRARASGASDDLARTLALASTGGVTAADVARSRSRADTESALLAGAGARARSARLGPRADDVALAQARLAEAEARVALDQRAVRTPVAGTVLWLRVRPGEHYSPLSPGRDAIAILGDLSALRARLDVDERDFPRVIVGARAEIVAASDSGGARRRARVVAIGQRVGRKNVRTDDPIERIDTKIVEVEVELEDGAGLKPGLRVVGYVEPGAP